MLKMRRDRNCVLYIVDKLIRVDSDKSRQMNAKDGTRKISKKYKSSNVISQ